MRFRKVFKKLMTLSLATVTIASLAMGAQSLAQQGDSSSSTANTLKISPLRTDLSADPGETKTVKITVTNPSSSEVSVKPIQNDFIADDTEDGSPAIILDENQYAEKNSLKRFMQPIESFNIPAGETVTVEATIAVPENAEAGGYFGAVRFAPTSPDGGGQVNTSPSVASLILLRVNGEVTERLELTDFQVRQAGKATNYLTSTNDISVLTRFKNNSKVQLAPFGMISVKKGNEVVHQADFNKKDQLDTILPDSARRWNVNLGNIEGFGRYEVTAVFTYGQNNQALEATQVFWVIPMPMIITVAAILLLLAIVVVYLISRRRGGKSKLSM